MTTTKTYCGTAADTAQSTPRSATTLKDLTSQLSVSMKRPTRRTITLIEKALSWLRPFESGKATVASLYEKRELLNLLDTHRLVLSPYIDVDRIESHLRRG